MILGVIPARGGSKGIPRKNLRPVAGKPLLVWTIEAARAAKRLDRWVVSTEDEEIAAVAAQHGAEVLRRPGELATDEASTLAVTQHALARIPADIVVVLHPTSPVRRDGLVDACIERLLAENADSLGTVHRDYSYEYGQDMPRRQEVKPRLVDNGNVYVLAGALVRQGRWLGDRLRTYETTREEGVEIDDAFDLWLAEQILLKRRDRRHARGGAAVTAGDVIVAVDGPADVSRCRREIAELLASFGFCVIRGVIGEDEVLEEYRKLSERFSAGDDIRRSGPIVYKMKNFQRLDCGEYSGTNAWVSRMLTRFFWNPDDLFSAQFRTLQQVRDLVADRHPEYRDGCYELDGSRYYEFPKILQYPTGGAFLNEHYDAYNNDGVVNIGMAVTQRGKHFQAGGIYYHLPSGEEVPVDEFLRPGDIYVHDPGAVHGVHAVDPDAPLNLSTFCGRVSLILSSETFAR